MRLYCISLAWRWHKYDIKLLHLEYRGLAHVRGTEGELNFMGRDKTFLCLCCHWKHLSLLQTVAVNIANTVVWRNSLGVLKVFEVSPPQRVRDNFSCGPCNMWGLGPGSPLSTRKSLYWMCFRCFTLILDYLQWRGLKSMGCSCRFLHRKKETFARVLQIKSTLWGSLSLPEGSLHRIKAEPI